MKILWFTWKDLKNPASGGAELVNEELARRLSDAGHEVILLVGGFPGAAEEENINGYKVIRVGGRWTVYWLGYRYYKKNLAGWPDLIIDEVNTIPFFVKFYAKEKNILFIHQLCREVWFYQMFFPLNAVGYFLEPIYLRLLKDREAVTVSESTKKDLLDCGFERSKIKTVSVGIEIAAAEDIGKIKKYGMPVVLSLGSVRSMKRTDQIVEAFILAKEKMPNLELIIAGDYSGDFGEMVFSLAKRSKYADSIEFLGKVGKEKKIELMQKSHLLCAASVKEGWGLVVTEANSQGTPAVAYGVGGLRDSVRHNETGLVCKENTPECLAENIIAALSDKNKYEKMRLNAWKWSKEINFERSYKEFADVLKNYEPR